MEEASGGFLPGGLVNQKRKVKFWKITIVLKAKCVGLDPGNDW